MLFSLANLLDLYINKCLIEKLNIFVIIYLNNIFIYTNEKNTKYKKVIKWVLKQLWKYVLYFKLKKWCFNINKIYFLDYIISFLKVDIEPKCIDSIKNWPEL